MKAAEKHSITSTDLAEARIVLADRLRKRLGEIETAVVTRVFAIADPREAADPEYLNGLQASLTTALDYALATIERGERRAPLVPPPLLAQARMAARNGVGLDTVLRRYLVGYSLFTDFAIEEAEDSNLISGSALQRLLRGLTAVFDRLIEAVTDEYSRESLDRPSSAEQRRAERVERLLAGELIDVSELAYDLDAFHLGLIASGSGAREAIKTLSTRFDKSLLSVRSHGDKLWGWLGSRHPIGPAHLTEILDWSQSRVSSHLAIAFGEPGEGIAGWRLTHRQAKVALRFAQSSPHGLARYSDVALAGAILSDDLLTTSLRDLYLAPLESDRDGGKVARETLRAYFACERSVSSAAASLGVRRHTVTSRLRTVEEALGRTLSACLLELELALRVDEQESDLRGGSVRTR